LELFLRALSEPSVGAGRYVPRDLRHLGELRHSAAGAQPTDGPFASDSRAGYGGEQCRRNRGVEHYRWRALVHGDTPSHSASNCVDRRKALVDAAADPDEGCVAAETRSFMKAKKEALTKPSEPEKVDAYMAKLKHPLTDVVAALRKIILSTDREIGEEIKWNAPTFFYSGEMKPSDPKEYKRYIIVFNLFQKDCIRLVVWKGARVNGKSGLLEGDYADGRRLVLFHSMEEVKAKKAALQGVIRRWLETLERD